MLRREGHIVAWYDRDILAGSDLDAEIAYELESCDLFLPMLSPDFLASDYCYETEMTRAIERHDAGDLRVIPIIIEPCDWAASPLRKLKALPNDGKPVAEWTNQNTAFLDIVTELRRVVDVDRQLPSSAEVPPTGTKPSKERRYRIKHDFDDIDRSEYRQTAFEEMRNYFSSAAAELNEVEGLRGRFAELGPHNFTCTVVNRAIDRGAAHITVHVGHENAGMGDIYYSFSENAPANTSNGGFRIESDEYELFLSPWMFTLSNEDARLSPRAAAEMLWTEFVQQAGVSHD
jgi:hypothetical protein